jgi:hypothetical protein
MSTQDTVMKAGDVSIKKIEIINSKGIVLDITSKIVSVEIYEDIFSPFIAGNFTLLDNVDISSALPLIGEERVNIEIETPSLAKIKDQFYLYKMTNKDQFNEGGAAYVLHFMSLEAIIDANKRISKVFAGKQSDIAALLFGSEGLNTKKNLNIEETRNSQKFIANFWSPIECLSHTMENAESKNGTPSYVFFENREGYVFASLETLYGVPPVMEFVYDNYTRTVMPDGNTVRDINQDYKRIQNMYVPELFNYIDRSQNGYYASALTSFDITTKKYTYRVFDAKTKTTKTLNDQALVSKGSNYRADALRIFSPKYYGNFNGYSDVTNTNSVQQRVALLKQAESLKVQITVPGRLDYTVGRTVKMEIYRNKPVRAEDKQNDVVDPVLSGLYMISALSHVITHKEHICNMELIKDSILKGT